MKIIPNPNGICLASNRTIEKYKKQRQKDNLQKKTKKKASKWLKKASFLGTDNLQTIDYNNDTSLDNLEAVDFNNDTQMIDLTNVDLKKTSAAQETAKKYLEI